MRSRCAAWAMAWPSVQAGSLRMSFSACVPIPPGPARTMARKARAASRWSSASRTRRKFVPELAAGFGGGGERRAEQDDAEIGVGAGDLHARLDRVEDPHPDRLTRLGQGLGRGRGSGHEMRRLHVMAAGEDMNVAGLGRGELGEAGLDIGARRSGPAPRSRLGLHASGLPRAAPMTARPAPRRYRRRSPSAARSRPACC